MAILNISITDVPRNLDPNPCEQDANFVVKRMNQVFWKMKIMKNIMVFWEVVPKMIKLIIAMKEWIQTFVFVTPNCAILPTIFKGIWERLLCLLQPSYTFPTISKICSYDYNGYSQSFLEGYKICPQSFVSNFLAL